MAEARARSSPKAREARAPSKHRRELPQTGAQLVRGVHKRAINMYDQNLMFLGTSAYIAKAEAEQDHEVVQASVSVNHACIVKGYSSGRIHAPCDIGTSSADNLNASLYS